ncbi:MAG: toll/interleukin-1 receptor domain-containing protein [Bacteroidales bacterium]|jgi:hypothetical protein|nr:toll/interleukin-1 receptor domain-containing protein [Bacteroidales bacterium]
MKAINRFYASTKYSSRAQFLNLGKKCIFISHQKDDKDDARAIAEYFQNAGIEVYFDEYDNDLRLQRENDKPNEVTMSICNGINNSSHMMVVVSPNTILSTWVPFEIGYGYDKTELGAICLKGIPKGKLPEYIRTTKIIRDIYDLNIFIQQLSGKTKEFLLESRMMSDHTNYANPLHSVMDDLISDVY